MTGPNGSPESCRGKNRSESLFAGRLPIANSAAEKGICLENLSHPRLLEGGARRGAVGGVARSATVFQAYILRSGAYR